ncbi:biotin/lipoyl-containing protein [Fusobacterium varium]|uniref:acetyl-CoA carboxylase biotin carboxyl carrier protein n=1 Tax=Fusobacterium varium TaxID=856 RepID=UPI000BBAA644|nr:biotin/lipoyl-containing protein [uncultured Fusobacterium sp.]BBA52568.1 putative acetyl-CoA carboxylase biotin carboxyl carrier protein subunit [Fusobacterium varium]
MRGDIKAVEELMKVLHEQKLTEISYEDSNFKVTIKGPLTAAVKKEIVKETKVIENKEAVNFKEVLSDHIGRYFYMKKNGEPVIEVGQKIKAGQEIGYISTVGVNTTITSSYSGTIEEIYIENGNPVDYGRPLLKIKI